jgi:hypothetical protein
MSRRDDRALRSGPEGVIHWLIRWITQKGVPHQESNPASVEATVLSGG